ncbi:hypothetical protein FSP39_013486 [Pinctada imbricata]|uniref:Uncharacterized protein n=1 Tax=Pinctada imbricata TaxID=66713 RepID=A0AA88XVK5_PINIB|nr:hypothetical protein FSP39_013486 [Pinctada imbricata]
MHILARDPSPDALDSLWDSFPCPPPWKPELILELGWTYRFPEDGQRLLSRVADRCRLDLMKLRASASQERENLIFKDCDINCFLLVLSVFICIIFLLVAIVAFYVRRRTLKRWKDKENSNSLAARSTYQPVPTESRTSEVVLANGRVTTRLENDSNGIHAFQNPKFYGKFYDSQLSRPNNVYDGEEASRQLKPYESPINDSEIQDPVERDIITNENAPLQNQYYSLQRKNDPRGPGSVVSYQRSQCSCPRCSQIALQQSPVPFVQCRCGRCSQLSVYHSGGTGYGSDGYTDYGISSNNKVMISKPKVDTNFIVNGDSKRRRHHSESGFAEDDYTYVDNAEVRYPQNNPTSSPVFLQSTSAFYPAASSKKCNCRRCSQNKLGFSDDENGIIYGVPNSAHAQSEFYGVPERTYPVQYLTNESPPKCNCKRCSQNSINLIERLESLELTVPTHYTEPETDMATVFTNYKTEHRKRKRNKMNRPVSLNTSSDETNTGSEKSFRSGVPKTNGSLLNAKFVNR